MSSTEPGSVATPGVATLSAIMRGLFWLKVPIGEEGQDGRRESLLEVWGSPRHFGDPQIPCVLGDSSGLGLTPLFL